MNDVAHSMMILDIATGALFIEFGLTATKSYGLRIGSKTTDECGDDWRRVHTTGDEYIRVGIVQETSTYEYRGQETNTYDRRRVHTSA